MTMPFFEAGYAASNRTMRLLDADPELLASVENTAMRPGDLKVATVRVQPGHWTAAGSMAERALALLVVEGVLVRTVHVRGQSRSELLGEGDLICPYDEEQHNATLGFQVDWDVLQPARLGLLDDAFFAVACRSPEVSAALMLRGVQRSHRLARQLAIGDLRRIDERLIALFLHLGDRWGRRTPAGIHVPLRLTHDLIAQLVGAQRPTVTTGLNELQRGGRLRRDANRTWIVTTRVLQRQT
jgi:CRP/FNR family cyclic AMP-dependent transcriptional regulator